MATKRRGDCIATDEPEKKAETSTRSTEKERKPSSSSPDAEDAIPQENKSCKKILVLLLAVLAIFVAYYGNLYLQCYGYNDPPKNEKLEDTNIGTKCLPLSNGAGSVWSPASCTQRNGKLDEYCTIQCADGYEHKGGNHVQCKPEGWQGPFFTESPTCFETKCLPLSDSAGSVWSPASCTQRNGKLDEYCTIQCAAGYEHKGGNHVQCKPEGWQGPFFPESPTCFGTKCLPLSNGAGSVWSPASCTQRNGKLDEYCTIQCAAGYEHKGGNHVQCKPEGWEGQYSLQTPTCFVIATLGEQLVDKINEKLAGRDANFLFLLDESGSVSAMNFEMEKRFIKSLVGGFPLSSKRAAGAIRFTDRATVAIPMNEVNTCSFMQKANKIPYTGQGTNIYEALKLARQEIKAHAVHPLTLVFLVTDGRTFGQSPTPEAAALKADGNILFTVGVADYVPEQLIPLASLDKDAKPLFYGIDNFQIFGKVADYLENKYSPEAIACRSN